MPEACSRCGRAGDAPPAHRVPFPKDVKQRVVASVCAACWQEWEGMEVKVINEYRLQPWRPEHQAFIAQQMEQYFFGEGAKLPEQYTPEKK